MKQFSSLICMWTGVIFLTCGSNAPALEISGGDLHIDEIEFASQPVANIISILAEIADIPLIYEGPDFQSPPRIYRDRTAAQILTSLMDEYGLLLSHHQETWIVSEIAISSIGAAWSFECRDAKPARILAALATRTRVPIRFRGLPDEAMTLILTGVSIDTILDAVFSPYPSIRISKFPAYTLIAPTDAREPQSSDEESAITSMILSTGTWSSDRILNLLPQAVIRSVEIRQDREGSSFLVSGSSANLDAFNEFFAEQMADMVTTRLLLNYLSPRDFLAAVDSPGLRNSLSVTPDGEGILYRGSRKSLPEVRNLIEVLDYQEPQVSYHILLIQYQHSSRDRFSAGMSARTAISGDRSGISAGLEEVLSLNFDVLSVFGYLFAAELNRDLSNSRARILADGSIMGVCGEPLIMENTTTYRYRDSEESSSSYTSVVRELTTGLSIRIVAIPSGANRLQVDLEIELSNQNEDTGNSGTPPANSTRLIHSTLICTDGLPERIAGIVMTQAAASGEGTLMLAGRETSEESSELVVFLLPRIQRPTVRLQLPDIEQMQGVLLNE